VADRWH